MVHHWKIIDGNWVLEKDGFVFIVSTLLGRYYLDFQICDGENVVVELSFGRFTSLNDAQCTATNLLPYLKTNGE